MFQEPVWKAVQEIATGILNTGQFEFNPHDHLCSGDDCDEFRIGIIIISLEGQTTPNKYRFVNKILIKSASELIIGIFYNIRSSSG